MFLHIRYLTNTKINHNWHAEVFAAEVMSKLQIPAFIFVRSSLGPQIICVYRMVHCISIIFV